MDPGAIAFRDQFRLGLEPMLHMASRLRTLVHITEISPSGHFVRRRDKINCALVQVRTRGWRWRQGRFWVLDLGRNFVLHAVSLYSPLIRRVSRGHLARGILLDGFHR